MGGDHVNSTPSDSTAKLIGPIALANDQINIITSRVSTKHNFDTASLKEI